MQDFQGFIEYFETIEVFCLVAKSEGEVFYMVLIRVFRRAPPPFYIGSTPGPTCVSAVATHT